MKKTKIFAVVMAAVMALSMVACGETQTNTTPTTAPATEAPAPTKAPDPTPTPVPEPQNVTIENASITFEDGKMDFAKAYMQHATSADVELSVVDYNGSKALKVVNVNGKVPFLALDVASLLGDNIAKVAGVEMVIGTSYDDGSFSAVSGEILSWYGEDLKEAKLADWSVYMAKKNPKVTTAKIPAGSEFVAGANNILLINLKTDNGLKDTGAPATFYVDDIRFYDAAGNTITADTSVAFVDPEGFEKTGRDANLLYVDNAVALDGFAVSAGGWAQAGITLTDEQRALFVPGCVVEIQYKCAEPVWLIAKGDTNPLGGWLRAVDQSDFVVDGYVANDKSTVQYTYEQLATYWGEDFAQHLGAIDCEGKADWEVYSVSVGMRSNFTNLGSKTALDGFAVSAGGWAQAGITLTDEQRALFVPGSVVEIQYKCAEPVWLIAKGDTNPLGGWLRAVDQSDFVVDGAVSEDGMTVQYTYEQLAVYWGEDFAQHLAAIDCEGKSDWEVYSVTVGKPMVPTCQNVNLDGFAVSAGGWAQAGITLTDEQRALFVPGSVVTIQYKCAEPVWLIAKGDTNPLGGWLRAVDQSDFVVDGAVSEDGTTVQYTYEQLAVYWGEDFAQHLAAIDCEGKSDWEVYSVTVGQAPTATETPAIETPATETPAAETPADNADILAEYAGDYGLGWAASVDELKAFTGNVTISFEVAYTGTVDYAQFTFIDKGDGWSKLKAEDFTGNVPTINAYEFIEMFDPSVTSYSTTITADALARIISHGDGLGIQVNGIVIRNAILTAAE